MKISGSYNPEYAVMYHAQIVYSEIMPFFMKNYGVTKIAIGMSSAKVLDIIGVLSMTPFEEVI